MNVSLDRNVSRTITLGVKVHDVAQRLDPRVLDVFRREGGNGLFDFLEMLCPPPGRDDHLFDNARRRRGHGPLCQRRLLKTQGRRDNRDACCS